MKNADNGSIFHVMILVFIFLTGLDLLVCLFLSKWLLFYSSSILLSGLLLSLVFSNKGKTNWAIVISLISYYTIGLFHTSILDNYIMSYFILLLTPLVCIFILKTFNAKIFVTGISCVLFLVTNHLAGMPLLSNYFFYFGLIPSVITFLHFHEKLGKLTQEKNNLILDLKTRNEEMILYSNMMSHDLKAPLRSINGFASILQNSITNERDKELFSFIIKGGESMSNLIDDILTYSRSSLEEYEFEVVNLQHVIDEILIHFKFELEEQNAIIDCRGLTEVYANKKTISLVFQNLISNALKYQPKTSDQHPLITISQENKQENTNIRINDNGIGIEPRNLKKLFNPFVRFHSAKEYDGSGLGLSLVKRIIDKHKGKIKVDSVVGLGSTFTISLPNR